MTDPNTCAAWRQELNQPISPYRRKQLGRFLQTCGAADKIAGATEQVKGALQKEKFLSARGIDTKRETAQAGVNPLLVAAGTYAVDYVIDRYVENKEMAQIMPVTDRYEPTLPQQAAEWIGWDPGVPGYGYSTPSDFTQGTHGAPVKSWVANGAQFQKNQDGTISVLRKDNTVKTYKPYKPIVFGKKLDAKKLARVAKKHRGIYKELHKLFGRKTCRK